MKEKIKVGDSEDFSRTILERQLGFKNDELKDILQLESRLRILIDIAKKVNDIDDNIHDIVSKKFRKLEYQYEYEKDKKFQKYMLEKQILLTEKNKINTQVELEKMEKQLKVTIEQKVLLQLDVERLEGELNE